MDIEAYKAMLERHAKERAELEKTLNDTLDERARVAAFKEKSQPKPELKPSWAKTDTSPPSEADIARHKHNLAIKDRQELAALDQKNAAEKTLRDQETPQQFNPKSSRQGIDTPTKLQFHEDQQPKQQPPVPGSQTDLNKPGLQFPEDINPKPGHHIKR